MNTTVISSIGVTFEEFKAAAMSSVVETDAYIEFVCGENTITADRSKISSFSVKKDGCVSGQFTLGSVSSSSLEITMLTSFANTISTGMLSYVIAQPYVGYKCKHVSGGVETEGFAYISLGVFFVDGSQTSKNGLFTSCVAYDLLYSDTVNGLIPSVFLDNFDKSASPRVNIAHFVFDTQIPCVYSGLPNTGTTPAEITGDMTCREVLSRLAVSIGANCLINSGGNVTFRYPSNTSMLSITPSNYSSIAIDQFENTNISFISAEIGDETHYYPNRNADLGIEFDSTYFTDAADLRTVWDRAVYSSGGGGITYAGVNAEIFDCPFIEPFDNITITDTENVTHEVTPLSVTVSYAGGIKTAINANTMSANSSTSNMVVQLAKAVEQLEARYIRERVHYTVCDTSGLTSEKVITFQGFEKYNGATLSVLFNHGNEANTVSLNINSEEFPSPVYANGEPLYAASTFNWTDNQIVDFIFDGTNGRWIIAGTNVSRYIGVVEGAGGSKTLTIAENENRSGFHVDLSATKLAMSMNELDMVKLTQAGVTVGDENNSYVKIEDDGVTIAQGSTEATLFADVFNVAQENVTSISFTNASEQNPTKLAWEKRSNGHLSLKVV